MESSQLFSFLTATIAQFPLILVHFILQFLILLIGAFIKMSAPY